MTLVRPTADIASFPAPGWTTAPLFEKVNSVERDDTTFIIGREPGAQDPQVSFALGDLEIPYGSSGRIEVRVAMRWSRELDVTPFTARIGLGNAVDLALDNPPLLFEQSLIGTEIFRSGPNTLLEFREFEVVFDYEDFSGNAAAFGIYIEMTYDDTGQDSIFPEISWIEVLACVPAVVTNFCSLGDLTAGAVITEARDAHPAFNKRQHPNGTLLRILSSYQRTITSKIARVNPGLCASQLLISLPFEDFGAGVKLPANTYVLPGLLLRTTINIGLKEPIDLVDATLRGELDMAHKFAYLRGNNIFLGRRASNYANFDQLILDLVLVPKTLERLTDVLLLPDWGEETYIGALVNKMAIRQELGGNVLLDAEKMEVEFLTTVAQQKAAQASGTLDVWPGHF